ncbi:MAG: PEP-CTERM sorting domain-containing protein [Cyanobacteriota bacterium]
MTFGAVPTQAAVPLLSGFGGPSGFGEDFVERNDDGFDGPADLPFEINFFGEMYDQFFVNNNGNITFESGLSAFTPSFFPGAPQPIIAPWWADVDTRNLESGVVYYTAPNADTVVVTWDRVGYYPSQADKLNSFQLVLKNRADTGAGNFDVEFRYNQLEWTTGSASGGSGGLGGIPAVAGFDAGDDANFFMLPGSRTGEVLDIINLSNVSEDTPGLWSFAIRNGQTPGTTPDNPLLPVVIDGEFNFDFNVPDTSTRIFIDPVVAVGYDYIVDSGPDITSVLLPTGIGDNLFELFADDSAGACTSFTSTGTTLTGGNIFNFTSPVRCFSVRGIEVGANLDPTDTLAFVTGLTFDAPGMVSLRQNPVTVSTVIPEPMTLAGVGAAVGIMGGFKRRINKTTQKKR